MAPRRARRDRPPPRDQRLELEDGVVDAALALERPRDQVGRAVDQLLVHDRAGTVAGLTGLDLGLGVLAVLERQLGEVEGEAQLVLLRRGRATQQLVGRDAQPLGEGLEHLGVGAAVPGLQPRDVAHRHHVTGELGLRPAPGEPGRAQARAQFVGPDLLQEGRVCEVHASDCD